MNTFGRFSYIIKEKGRSEQPPEEEADRCPFIQEAIVPRRAGSVSDRRKAPVA
jgi:hypothetical protein